MLLIREAIRRESLPFQIHVVADGEEAMEFIARADADEDAPCPALILIDLNLPKRDGFEVLRHVRASRKCKSVPVMVVTSSDAPSDRKLASDLGAGYFRKPPSYHEFLRLGNTLKHLMEGRAQA